MFFIYFEGNISSSKSYNISLELVIRNISCEKNEINFGNSQKKVLFWLKTANVIVIKINEKTHYGQLQLNQKVNILSYSKTIKRRKKYVRVIQRQICWKVEGHPRRHQPNQAVSKSKLKIEKYRLLFYNKMDKDTIRVDGSKFFMGGTTKQKKEFSSRIWEIL